MLVRYPGIGLDARIVISFWKQVLVWRVLFSKRFLAIAYVGQRVVPANVVKTVIRLIIAVYFA